MKVYVPTWNSARTLDQCLSLIERNIPNAQIHIVDRFSSDDTLKIANKHNAVVTFSTGNVGEARSFMCNQNDSSWFVMVDSDVYLSDNWLQNMERHLVGLDQPIGAVQSNDIATPTFTDEKLETAYKQYASWKRRHLKFPTKNPARLDTNATLFLNEAVKGFKCHANAFEDYQLGKYLNSKGFWTFAVDVPVYHDMLITPETFKMRCRCSGAAIRNTGQSSFMKLFAAFLVRPLQAPFGTKQFTARQYYQHMVGWIHSKEYERKGWNTFD